MHRVAPYRTQNHSLGILASSPTANTKEKIIQRRVQYFSKQSILYRLFTVALMHVRIPMTDRICSLFGVISFKLVIIITQKSNNLAPSKVSNNDIVAC